MTMDLGVTGSSEGGCRLKSLGKRESLAEKFRVSENGSGDGGRQWILE